MRIGGLLGLAAALAAGCGDDSGSMTPDAGVQDTGSVDMGRPDMRPPPPPDAGRDDAGADAEMPTGARLVVRTTFAGRPRADVEVALDAPGGERVIEHSDDMGVVTFDGIDWSLGSATLSAWMTGQPVLTITELTEESLPRVAEDDGSVLLAFGEPPPFEIPAPVTVSVVIANSPGGGPGTTYGALWTSVSNPGLQMPMAGANYAVQVAPGEPFEVIYHQANLQAPPPPTGGFEFDFSSWALTEVPALTADTTVTVDFETDRVDPVLVAGSLTLPEHMVLAALAPFPGPFLMRRIDLAYQEPYAYSHHGWATSAVLSADGRTLAYEGEYLALDSDTPENVVTQWILQQQAGRFPASSVLTAGPPGNGPQELPFIDPPRAVDPGPLVLTDAIELELFDDLPPVLYLVDGMGRLLWGVQLASGNTLVLPDLPASFTTEIARASAFSVILQQCDGPGDVSAGQCSREALANGPMLMR